MVYDQGTPVQFLENGEFGWYRRLSWGEQDLSIAVSAPNDQLETVNNVALPS